MGISLCVECTTCRNWDLFHCHVVRPCSSVFLLFWGAAVQPSVPVPGCYPTLDGVQLLKVLPKHKLLPSQFSYIILMGTYMPWNTVLRKSALIELYALFDLPLKSEFIIQITCVMENRCRPAEANDWRVRLLLVLFAFPSERKHNNFFLMSSCIVQVLEFKFENHSS